MWNFKSKTDAIDEAKKQAEKERIEQYKKLTLACKELFKDQNGIFLLKFLKDTCLWDSQNTNIDKDILAYQKGRRDIWLILRTLLPKDVLAKVEIFK